MIYYANPSTEQIRDEMMAGRLGCITTPHQGNVTFPSEWDVIADNGCFSDKWSERHWWEWLRDQPRSVRFAVCPDVFDPSGAACHEQTVERWERFGLRMRIAGFTPAFVCQVGATAENVPTDAEVLFLGGTTEWKLGPDAWAIVNRWSGEKWVHMGRVNSKRRFDTARAMGCHSVDGTFVTFGPDVNLPKLLGWLEAAHAAPMLGEASWRDGWWISTVSRLFAALPGAVTG